MKIKKYDNINEVTYSKKLNNGLKITVIQKKGFNNAFAALGVKFGSIDINFIPDGNKNYINLPLGVAHFLEHKSFEMPNDIDATNTLENIGFMANAYTTFNETVYMISGVSNIIRGTEELLKFVQTPYFTDESIKKEIGIIIQELKMYMDIPSEVSYTGLLENMFKENPIRYDIAGTINSIGNINKDILYQVYNTFYNPSNMHLVIAGDINIKAMIEKIEEIEKEFNFSKIIEIRKKIIVEDNCVYKQKTIKKMDIIVPKISIGVKLPYEEYKDNEMMVKEIKLKILLEAFIGKSSKTYQDLLDNELINSDYNYSVYLGETCGFIKITTSSNNPEKFINYITDLLLNISKYKLDNDKFLRFKKALYGNFIKSLNDLERTALGVLEFSFKNCDYFYCLNLINNIKLNDFNSLYKYFTKEALTYYIINPK